MRTLGKGSGGTGRRRLQLLRQTCRKFTGDGCSTSMSGGVTGIVLGRCHDRISPGTRPACFRLVSGGFGKSASQFISCLFRGSVFNDRSGFGGFLSHPSIGTLRGSPVVLFTGSIHTRRTGLGGTLGRFRSKCTVTRHDCMGNLLTVCNSHTGFPSTGFALHLACKRMGKCDPHSYSCCNRRAALSKIVRGRSSAG